MKVEKKVKRRLEVILLSFAMLFGSVIEVSAFPSQLDKRVSLTLHKYEMQEMPIQGMAGNGIENIMIPEGARPLPEVEFFLYKIDEDYSEKDEDGSYKIPNREADRTGTTDQAGTLLFQDLDQGRYLVAETKDAVHEKGTVFVVDLPMLRQDGNGWNYEVHAYPKSAAVLGSVVLQKIGEGKDERGLKDVEFKIQRKNSEGVYQDVKGNFTTSDTGLLVINNLIKGEYRLIETKAPEGYGLNTTPIPFEISKNGEAELNGEVKEGKVVFLSFHNLQVPTEPEKKVDKTSVNVGEEVNWSITPAIPGDVSTYKKYLIKDTLDKRLTYVETKVYLEGDGKLEEVTKECQIQENNGVIIYDLIKLKEKIAGQTIQIKIKTLVNEKVLGQPGAIHNTVKIAFENGYGTKGEKEENGKEIFIGNIKVNKTDSEEEGVQGASFALYHTKEDAESESNPIVCEGKKEQITGRDGAAYFKGLKTGTYYLVETKVPTYEKLGQAQSDSMVKEVKEVKLTANEKTGVCEVAAVNKQQGFHILRIGDINIRICFFFGLIILLLILIVLFIRKKHIS